MKCPNCNCEVSELDEKCTKCGIIFEDYEESHSQNSLEEKFSYGAKTVYLRFINCIQIIVLVIMGLISFSKDQIVTGILYIVIGVVLLFFIKGFSDIIDLLDSINNKMK